MTTFIKIFLSFVAFFICGNFAIGCNKATQLNPAARIGGIFPILLLVGALIGIWKYNPNKNNPKDPGKL